MNCLTVAVILQRKNSQEYSDEVRQLVEEACQRASGLRGMTCDTAMYYAST